MTTPPDEAARIALSGYTNPGFAERYERHRPSPPAALADLLTQYAGGTRPRLVVDLGSGTGLSARFWAGQADEVIGVEPNAEMRAVAAGRTAALGLAATVRYVDGYGHRTGLPGGAADIVTCAQSLHWMEPESTLAEVARLLRPGGVFAAYDYAWPPAVHWEVERAWAETEARAHALGGGEWSGARWAKSGHLGRIRASGHFRHAREVLLHAREEGDTDRCIGLLRSQSFIERALAAGASEADLGLDTLRAVAARALGDRAWPWYFGYTVRLGIR